MIVKDQLNRTLHLPTIPKRIISLVPSLTELLVDLGLEASIVGITKFCVHPKNLRKQKASVGGTKTVKIDTIKALQPDIILCNKEENSKEIIDALIAIAPIHVSDICTLKDAYQLIEMYGVLFDVEEHASTICNTINKAHYTYKQKITDTPRPKVAYFIWKSPWMVVANNTFINAMLEDAGFDNVFHNETRYPEISLDHEALTSADIIMLSTEPYPFTKQHQNALTVQFPRQNIIIVDGELFSWYGSRLQYTFHYISKLREELIV